MLATHDVSWEDKAVASVRLSVRPFVFYLLNGLIFELKLVYVCVMATVFVLYLIHGT